jgi:hypothetical protein
VTPHRAASTHGSPAYATFNAATTPRKESLTMENLNLNLDCFLDPAELENVASALNTLSAYAKYKARSMRHRVTGNIDAAMCQEHQCDRIYSWLPEWARW